jgi:NADP-dependent 3-hydroxy acid dehydrogenase YdfG
MEIYSHERNKSMPSLEGKIVMVTGAGSGMGKAIALALSKLGANLAMIGRRLEALKGTAALIEKQGGECFYRSVDISKREKVDTFVEDLIQKWERVDILVNAAGINTPKRSWADTNPAEWDQVIAINLTGTYNCIQSVLPHMRRIKQGQIIDINSGAGRKASKMGGLAYSVSKHGMVAIGQTINDEEWINGVRATEIFIGETNTPILHQRKYPMPPERYEAMLQPEDVAPVVEFLATLPGHILIEDIRPRHISRKFSP